MFRVFLILLLMSTPASAEFMIVGHRGAAGHAPENTLASIRVGIELGATHIEIDLHQSKDGHVVVIHDSSVNRTTNGTGKVRDKTLAELQALDAGSWFGDTFQGEKIPTLESALQVLREHEQIGIILEVKEGADVYPNIEENIVGLVHAFKLEKRTIYKSFDKNIVKRFLILAPESERLLVYWNPLTSVIGEDVQYLQPLRHIASRKHILRAKSKKYKVIVWDVQTKKKMKQFIDNGADGIETDYPDYLREVLQQRQ